MLSHAKNYFTFKQNGSALGRVAKNFQQLESRSVHGKDFFAIISAEMPFWLFFRKKSILYFQKNLPNIFLTGTFYENNIKNFIAKKQPSKLV